MRIVFVVLGMLAGALLAALPLLAPALLQIELARLLYGAGLVLAATLAGGVTMHGVWRAFVRR